MSERNRHTRRDLLKTIGAVGIGATVLSSTPAAAADDRYDYQFDTVINMVDEGADPTGEEPIDDLLEELAADNTLLYFPEGRYKLNQFRNGDFDTGYTAYENFGLRGAGSGKTYLVPREGQGSDEYGTGYFDRLWFELRHGKNYLVEGFTFDFTAERTGARFQLVPTGGFVMRDVRVEGTMDNPHGALLFWVLDEDAYGLVQNVRLPDGATSPTESFTTNGMYVGRSTNGTITFRNCHVEGFTDNGLYASNPSAPAAIHVEGGLYRNNNISQVRLGTPDSYVRNARVEVTEKIDTWYTVNMRGIRAATGSGVSVKNCDVVMSADAPSSGAIVGNRDAGDVTVENTRIRVDDPFESFAVFGKSNDIESAAFTLKNVQITGSASGGSADWPGGNASVLLQDRDGSVFENVCLSQTGADRDGIYLANSDATVIQSAIDVTGDAIIDDESTVTTRKLRSDGHCTSPQP